MLSPLARAARSTALVVSLVASQAVATRAQNPAPADVLRDQGLTRAQGATWVLETEALPLKAFKNVQALAARVKSGEAQLRDIEANQDPKALANAYRAKAAMLGQQLMVINQQMQQLGSGYRRGGAGNMYQNPLNQQRTQIQLEQRQLNDMANNLNSQGPQFEEQKKQFSAEVEKVRTSYQEAVEKLRESVEKVMSKYEELGKDEPVVKALADISTAAKIKQKLGPSKEFLTMLKWLGGFATVQTETINLSREDGVDHIDVQLGGGSPVKMVLDTAAAQVILPAGIASKLSLKSTDRTVEWKAPGGTAVTVPEMTILSVKVGRMTAKDVACAVVPAEQGEVVPVLGQSFLQQFDYKHLQDAGKLVLSKHEAEQAAEKPRTGAAKSKSSARQSKAAGKG
jgi:hypothetical protein